MRLQSIEISVADVARASRFYADVLDFPPVVRMGDTAATFFLGDVHGGMVMLVRSATPITGSGPAIVFGADGGMEAAKARLEARGVRFTNTEHSPLGLTAYFNDTEGNRLAIFDGSRAARFREQARAPLAELQGRLGEAEACTWAALDGLSERQARHVPGDGAWTIIDHIGHVVDSLDSCGQLVNELAAGLQPARDRLWRKEYPSPSLALAREELGRAFTGAHAWMKELPPVETSTAMLPHGVFGPLNHREWVTFMLFHIAMHAGQVKEIRAAPGFPGS
ncbi:MAG: DinB family protein [Dehalococcoidia bacterium]|nr:DinB family protein [Dehalococcoidia bacterium]